MSNLHLNVLWKQKILLIRFDNNSRGLGTAEESTGVLRKAESEYKGHRSLLMRTRNLLSTMQRQDVIDRYKRVITFL